MEPFDWLKQKAGQLLGDIGTGVSNVVHGVENGVSGGGGTPAAPPAPTPANPGGNIQIGAAPSQSLTLARTQPAPTSSPAAVSPQQPSQAQTFGRLSTNAPAGGPQPAGNPVVSGVGSVNDVNQQLNNPLHTVQTEAGRGATVTAQQGGRVPLPSTNPGGSDQLAQVAQAKGMAGQPVMNIAKPGAAPVAGTAPKPTIQTTPGTPMTPESLGSDVEHLAVNTAKGIVSPAGYLLNADIYAPGRALIAQATNNPVAYQHAETAQATLAQPREFLGNTAQIGLDLAAPGVARAAESGITAATGALFPDIAGTVARSIALGYGGAHPVLDTAIKYGVPIVSGAAMGGPYNVSQQVATPGAPLNPAALSKAYLQGTGYGAGLGVAGDIAGTFADQVAKMTPLDEQGKVKIPSNYTPQDYGYTAFPEEEFMTPAEKEMFSKPPEGVQPAANDLADQIRAKYTTPENPTPEQKYAIDYLTSNPEKAMQDYDQRTMKEFGVDTPNVVAGDEAKFVIPGMNAENSSNYHEPASALAKVKYDQLLNDENNQGKPVLIMAGGSGAGKTSSLRSVLQGQGNSLNDYAAIIDTNSNKMQSADGKIQQALNTGHPVDVIYVYREPIDAFQNGVIPRAAKIGRVVPVQAHLDTHLGSQDVVRQLAQKYAGNYAVDIQAIDNSRGAGNATAVPLEEIPNMSYNRDNLQKQLEGIINEQYQTGKIQQGEAETYLGRPIENRPQTLETNPETANEQPQPERNSRTVENPQAPVQRQQVLNDYADMISSIDETARGGMMIPDGEGGYVRTSEHTPFYRDFYARNGKAPTQQDYVSEAQRQLESGHADPYAQALYDASLATMPPQSEETGAGLQDLINKATPPDLVNYGANTLKPITYLSANGGVQHTIEPTGMSEFSREFNAKPYAEIKKTTTAANVPGVKSAGAILRESHPEFPGAPYHTVELITNPETGKPEQRMVDYVNGERYVRDANGNPTAPQGKIKDQVTQYADTFGITTQQARKELAAMAKEQEERRANTEETQRFDQLFGEPQKLTIAERRRIIMDNPRQQSTMNHVDLDVPEGNIKGAIAKSMAVVDERDRRLLNTERQISKLNEHDKMLVYRWEDGEDPHELAKEANDPEQFITAVATDDDAFDYHLAADRAAGGSTLRQPNYVMPKIFKLTTEEMDKMGIPEQDRYTNGQYTGFHAISSKYRSYLDAYRRKGLQPLYDNPEEAIEAYRAKGTTRLRSEALFTALSHAAPTDIESLDTTSMGGKRFTQAAGHLPFAVSDELQPYLNGFKKGWESRYKPINMALRAAEKTNAASKAILFFGAPFHYGNGLSSYLGVTWNHPLLAGKGTGEAIGSSVIPGVYRAIVRQAEEDGTMQFIRENGGVLKDTEPKVVPGNGMRIMLKNAANRFSPFQLTEHNMAAFFNTFMITLGRAAKEYGIENGSHEAQELFAEYNKVLGHYNGLVEGADPNIRRLISGEALAPYWLRTQLGLAKDVFVKSAVPGYIQGERVFGLYNAGDVARNAVVGKRLVEAASAVVLTALLTGKMPTFHQVLERIGVLPNNPIANVNAGQKDQKGRSQVMELPTDPLGLVFGLVTDPKHFTQSRFSPLGSFIDRMVTNQNWNGEPLVNKNDPGWQKQIVIKALEGNLPIGVQNFTNPNIDISQALAQEVGGREKTNPYDAQIVSVNNHYKMQGQLVSELGKGNLSAINPSLKNVSPQEGTYWQNEWNSLHPATSIDPVTGQTLPRDWNALGSEQEASYYLSNDQKTGQQQLSPLFYIDQKLASQEPNRPHNPLFDLSGTGVGVDGKAAPKAQIALDYTNMMTGDPQRTVVLAANPWLKAYETAKANYATNYTQEMTNYMLNEGWTPSAIKQYWQQHPSSNAPVQPPQFDQVTNDLMTQYDNITDPTTRSQFFAAHAAQLSAAFDAEAQYVNQKRLAGGELALQGYPTESAHVTAVLNSMPQGQDTASKKTRAQMITGNPDVNQYLADVALYDTVKNLSAYAYVNPTAPTLDEGQLLNSGSTTAQKTLKDISSLGAYDIAKNANGTYAFMQNGGFSAGFAAGGSGAGSKSTYKPFVKYPKKPYVKVAHRSRPPRIERARKVYVRQSGKGSSGVSGAMHRQDVLHEITMKSL